jgi:uncharacterized protein (DUF2249 family)
MTVTSSAATTADVRGLLPSERCTTVSAAFKTLALGAVLEIVNDNDPKPLYRQLQADAPGNFSWVYLENGPDVWRVSITKLSRTYSAGECCGSCGGKA